MRIPLMVVLASALAVVGCASQARLDHPALENDSRRVIVAINQSLERVDRSDLSEDEKQHARDLLLEMNNGLLTVDLLVARLSGSRLSAPEAREVEATLAAVYRAMEGFASRPPASLARGGASLTPEAERMLDDLRRLAR